MDIKIRIGKTRVVIVFGRFAYKIVRLRIIDLFRKWIRLEYERKVLGDEAAFSNAKRHTRKQLIEDMLWACFLANYREYQHWHKFPDKTKYVPTLFTFCYWVNIQERDEVAEDYSNNIFSLAHGRKCGDSPPDKEHLHLDNFTVSGRMLDYGRMIIQ